MKEHPVGLKHEVAVPSLLPAARISGPSRCNGAIACFSLSGASVGADRARECD